MKERLLAIELFVGAGGVSEALKESFQSILAVEKDFITAQTYLLNHPQNHLIVDDIQNLDPVEILKEKRLKVGDLDLLVSTPPCQGFSRHIRRNSKTHQDERNELIMETIRFSNIFQPKFIFMENVPNIVNFEQFSKFVFSLSNIDSQGYKENKELPSYHIRFGIVEAQDYGVPQKRKRMILIAKRIEEFPCEAAVVKEGEKGIFISTNHEVWPEKSKRITLSEHLSQYTLPQLNAGETCPRDSLHKARKLSPLNLERIKATPHNGGTRAAWPDKLVLDCHRKKGVSFGDVYGRMDYFDFAPTMTTGCTSYSKGRFGHPVENRAISLREAALIQTFPLHYIFTGTPKGVANEGAIESISTQIGNAVPVNLSKAIINSIKDEIVRRSQDELE